MINFRWTYLVLIIGLVFFGYGCTDPPLPALGPNDRNLIDSLTKEKIKVIKPKLDSICDSGFDKRVKNMVDSIMKERLDEIEAQLKRKQQKENQSER